MCFTKYIETHGVHIKICHFETSSKRPTHMSPEPQLTGLLSMSAHEPQTPMPRNKWLLPREIAEKHYFYALISEDEQSNLQPHV